jgi:pimeloyl-ACP methyl ester carboxylesterase
MRQIGRACVDVGARIDVVAEMMAGRAGRGGASFAGMTREVDVVVADGRRLHVYDSADAAGSEAKLNVFWHHGSPQAGPAPAPLVADAARQRIRWVSYNRPGYSGSTEQPGRDVAAAAADVAAIANHLGIARFAVMGASGGGPHCLACAALLPERVLAAVSVASFGPFGAEGLDWYAGMARGGVDEFKVAEQGREALLKYISAGQPFEPDMFPQVDLEALGGPYGEWLGATLQLGLEGSGAGYADDDLAFLAPWGFDPASIGVPLLVVQGGEDRLVPRQHGAWLAEHCPTARLWARSADGHLSIFMQCGPAVDWLRSRAAAI